MMMSEGRFEIPWAQGVIHEVSKRGWRAVGGWRAEILPWSFHDIHTSFVCLAFSYRMSLSQKGGSK